MIYNNLTQDEQDIALVKFFVNKFIKKYPFLISHFDDLVTECLINLIKKKHLYDSSRGSYSTFVYNIILSTFHFFINKLFSKKRKSNLNTISLDEILSGTEDYTLLETLQGVDDMPLDTYLNYAYLLKICHSVLENKSEKFKKICNHILNGETDIEIARKYKVTREYIRIIHANFALLVYIKLKQDNYILPSYIKLDLSKKIYPQKLVKKYYEVENETTKN